MFCRKREQVEESFGSVGNRNAIIIMESGQRSSELTRSPKCSRHGCLGFGMSRMFPVTENLIPSGLVTGEKGRFVGEQLIRGTA